MESAVLDDRARRTDPGRALRAALCSGGRRIHVDVTDDGVRLRIRVGSRLREIAHLPSDGGHAMVRLLESTARDGVGVLQLDGGKIIVRYRLAACEAPSSKKLVLTVLPDRDEQPVRGVADLGVPEEIQKALSADIAGRKGLVLVAGIPHSGRVRTLHALAGEANPTEESVLLLSFDGVAPAVSGYPGMTLDLRHELWLHRASSRPDHPLRLAISGPEGGGEGVEWSLSGLQLIGVSGGQ